MRSLRLPDILERPWLRVLADEKALRRAHKVVFPINEYACKASRLWVPLYNSVFRRSTEVILHQVHR
jgi:hypothetical protein